MDKQIATIGEWVDVAKAFLVTYSFQILGAIIFLVIGLKISAWLARLTLGFAQRHGLDITVATFASNVVRVAVIGLVVIATLGNFGISISALVAMVGAGTFGATLAIQGTLSNYGAGLSLVINRPFAVGDNITVKGVTGVVEEITLAATFLAGKDGERIMVPNRQIIGEILANSRDRRSVETLVKLAADQDVGSAAAAIRAALAREPEVARDPSPDVGVHGFGPGDVTLAIRYWVPARAQFQTQSSVNLAVRTALQSAGVKLA
jgi:small conductance mechanosensitive channel